jgi:hypothetical protein
MPRRVRATIVIGVGALTVGATRDAQACGAAYPGGPMVCTLEDAPPSRHGVKTLVPVARVSAIWSYTSTTILFGEGRRADLTRHAVFASTELPLARGLGLRFGAGGIASGELRTSGGPATFGPGVTGFFGIGKTVVDEKPSVPFLQLAATVSMSRATTRGPAPNEAPSFTALDVRAAATIGKTIGGWLVPYVSLRAFGGPIFYRYGGKDVTGTDLYKHQIAGGLSVALPSRVLDAFVEGVPMGESGMSAGLGTTF